MIMTLTPIEIFAGLLAFFFALRGVWRFIVEERKRGHKLLLNETTGFFFCSCGHWRYHQFDGRPDANHAQLSYNEHIKQVGYP
jgi:hypothetical protein